MLHERKQVAGGPTAPVRLIGVAKLKPLFRLFREAFQAFGSDRRQVADPGVWLREAQAASRREMDEIKAAIGCMEAAAEGKGDTGAEP